MSFGSGRFLFCFPGFLHRSLVPLLLLSDVHWAMHALLVVDHSLHVQEAAHLPLAGLLLGNIKLDSHLAARLNLHMVTLLGDLFGAAFVVILATDNLHPFAAAVE